MQNNGTNQLEDTEEKKIQRQKLFGKNQSNLVDKHTLNKWSMCVFGECGQGKSTLLSLLSKLYCENYAKDQHPCDFYSGKSFGSVTSCVKVGTTGDMILIDTPGFNDTNVQRSDKRILNELIQTIRPMLYDSKVGISGFIQCIMPDESDRIRATSMKAMNQMLFILNSFDARADVGTHPRMILVFNDVSLHSTEDKPETIREQKKEAFKNNTERQSQLQRVKRYLYDLKEIAKTFYIKD